MFPNQSIRYKLAPQMKQYDSVKHVWKPFIMFFNEANIKSKVLNLDKFGLRFNDLNNLKNLDIETNNSIFNEKIFIRVFRHILPGFYNYRVWNNGSKFI